MFTLSVTHTRWRRARRSRASPFLADALPHRHARQLEGMRESWFGNDLLVIANAAARIADPGGSF